MDCLLSFLVRKSTTTTLDSPSKCSTHLSLDFFKEYILGLIHSLLSLLLQMLPF